ncbi:hypothetical protein [Kitasatospora sp. NPDC008115]
MSPSPCLDGGTPVTVNATAALSALPMSVRGSRIRNTAVDG